jgi:NADH-quinone oxidoreductase subunit L
MPDGLLSRPGLLFVAAALLPLFAFAALLVAGTVRQLAGRRFAPGRVAALVATVTVALSAVCSLAGLACFLSDAASLSHEALEQRYSGRIPWLSVGPLSGDEHASAVALEVGYRIDHLSAVLFAMITVIATLIFVFSLGYMDAEAKPEVTDHTLHGPGGHGVTRRGRLGRFFLYLLLFTFAMLNLVLADNLFQVFVSWELVGVCSYFLIGFYHERPAAGLAATKAFLFNRVGDVGFLAAIMIAWTYAGTLNIADLGQRLRSPERDAHGPLELGGRFVRVEPAGPPEASGPRTFDLPAIDAPPGSYLALFPLPRLVDHFHGLGFAKTNDQAFDAFPAPGLGEYNAMPYGLFVALGLGLFLGCVGKSAQFPLHAWLPDAMEGPTPVSALIHAATMVAAGVYLVGRCFALFAPEALVVVAYVGGGTALMAATMAVVATDIKRVLAYSTVSQLGFMMLALGVGGWAAGLFHLVTHAFFKALLFLGAGSVIHGCHEEQDLLKMGGLRRKMPLTAYTMLLGVLAIIGVPLFSGWYSKDAIAAAAFGYAALHPEHWLLAALPVAAAFLTAFYMPRLWLLAFAGRPRDEHAHAGAHESPAVMTLPLIILAVGSVVVGWGLPPWDAHASWLEHALDHARPAAVETEFGAESVEALVQSGMAGRMLMVATVLGAGLALAIYVGRVIDPAAVSRRLAPVTAFLDHRWYLDALYQVLLYRPALALAAAARAFDKPMPDARVTAGDPFAASEVPDVSGGAGDGAVPSLDGAADAAGRAALAAGGTLRAAQTGSLRGYVLVLALTALAIFAILRWV